MKINGQYYRSIWEHPSLPGVVQMLDQRFLPHRLVFLNLRTLADAAAAIREMKTRGAPLVGLTAAYGIVLALNELQATATTNLQDYVHRAGNLLKATRPTAVNLPWAVDRMLEALAGARALPEAILLARQTARQMLDDDAEACRQIGLHGLPIIREVAERNGPGKPVNILTHCNAGWLACADYGTATSPIYQAHDLGMPVHVWVEETRPRNQGALTAWELMQHGVPHTVVVDNAGGHLMQHGLVDMVFVGTDRTTRMGDVANKIGTYQKALCAKDNGVPFYAMVPSSSIDWAMADGVREIPIEQRDPEEVTHISGIDETGKLVLARIYAEGSQVANFGFDVTPSRLITGLVTERGICAASEAGMLALFPELAAR